jgi:hypothetical protein
VIKTPFNAISRVISSLDGLDRDKRFETLPAFASAPTALRLAELPSDDAKALEIVERNLAECKDMLARVSEQAPVRAKLEQEFGELRARRESGGLEGAEFERFQQLQDWLFTQDGHRQLGEERLTAVSSTASALRRRMEIDTEIKQREREVANAARGVDEADDVLQQLDTAARRLAAERDALLLEQTSATASLDSLLADQATGANVDASRIATARQSVSQLRGAIAESEGAARVVAERMATARVARERSAATLASARSSLDGAKKVRDEALARKLVVGVVSSIKELAESAGERRAQVLERTRTLLIEELDSLRPALQRSS